MVETDIYIQIPQHLSYRFSFTRCPWDVWRSRRTRDRDRVVRETGGGREGQSKAEVRDRIKRDRTWDR